MKEIIIERNNISEHTKGVNDANEILNKLKLLSEKDLDKFNLIVDIVNILDIN